MFDKIVFGQKFTNHRNCPIKKLNPNMNVIKYNHGVKLNFYSRQNNK